MIGQNKWGNKSCSVMDSPFNIHAVELTKVHTRIVVGQTYNPLAIIIIQPTSVFSLL